MPALLFQRTIDRRLQLGAKLVAAVVATGGALVLAGWEFDNGLLKSGVTGLVAMNPATAVFFILAAISLVLMAQKTDATWTPRIARGLSALVALGGASRLVAYLTAWDLGIDGILFTEALDGNRMAPNTAAHFVFLGLALVAIDVRFKWGLWPTQIFALTAVVGSMMSLLGYGFGARQLYGIGPYIPMALNTAAFFAAMSLGVLCARSNQGVVALLTGAHVGSAMARRLLPAAVAITCILGVVRLLGQQAGFFGTEFAVTAMVVANIVLLSAAILFTAGALNRADAERRAATEAIHQLNESLEQRVLERTTALAATNRDLSQKNQENEMFVYSVSHDLRSPLVNLQGFSKELTVVAQELKELLTAEAVPMSVRERGVSLLEGDLHQSLRFIQSAVTRLSNIIDALLQLSRVGRVEYQCRDVNMNSLVENLVESMGATLFDRGVSLHVQKLSACHGDPTALEQLFANLIGNAVKYLDPKRPGVIEVGEISSAERPSLAGARLPRTYYVKDNGLGIPATYHEKIFQAFKRVHPEVASGEGMGLAIVDRIVQRHAGELWVESQEGLGSTFFVTLPGGTPRGVSPSRINDPEEENGYASRTDRHLVGGRR